jgi:hypothetical protein
MENNMLSSKNINLDVNNLSSNENSPKNIIFKNLKIEINNNYSPQYSNQLNAFFEQFSGK